MATTTENRSDSTTIVHEAHYGKSASRSQAPRWILILAVLAIVVAAGVYGASRLVGLQSQATIVDPSSLFEVKRTELIVTVTEDGNVESANNIDVKCRVAGGSTILWIVTDGSEVKKGDKLVELDASALEDQINTQKIAFNKAKATLVSANTAYEVAKLTVREYLEGTFQQELETADTQIIIAEENLRSSKNALDYSKRMFERGYISELELESQEFTVKRAELELSAANTAKRVLVDFTKIKTLEDLKSKEETAKSTLESEQAAFELEEAKLQRLETQLVNCTINAPQDGMVVYANERGGRFGSQQTVTIEEGAAVRDRQTILRLPDLSAMQVKLKVHETKVEQLSEDMRARVNIQGRQYLGYVTSIANQHEATSFFSGDVKEYATIVRMEGTVDGLKPGMTAEAEILVDHLKDVLTVPVSAVIEQHGEFVCWIQTPAGGIERRSVALGKSDDNFVEVKQGLTAGDKVLRNPRSVVPEAREYRDEAQGGDVKDRFGGELPADGDGGGRRSRPSAEPEGAERGDAVEGDGPRDGGSPGRGGRGAGRGVGGGRGGLPNLMDSDQDGDGMVSLEEAPEFLQSWFDRVDTNGDGQIDQAENAAFQQRARQFGRGRASGEPDEP